MEDNPPIIDYEDDDEVILGGEIFSCPTRPIGACERYRRRPAVVIFGAPDPFWLHLPFDVASSLGARVVVSRQFDAADMLQPVPKQQNSHVRAWYTFPQQHIRTSYTQVRDENKICHPNSCSLRDDCDIEGNAEVDEVKRKGEEIVYLLYWCWRITDTEYDLEIGTRSVGSRTGRRSRLTTDYRGCCWSPAERCDPEEADKSSWGGWRCVELLEVGSADNSE